MKIISTYFILFSIFTSSLCLAQWTQVGYNINGTQDSEMVGTSVQISDDGQIIATGAPLLESAPYNSGEIRVYKNIDGFWQQMGESIVSDPNQSEFGYFITMSGDGLTIAASSYGTVFSGNPWRVEVFHYESGIWQQRGSALIEATMPNSFGRSIKLSQDGLTLAVGAVGQGPLTNITQGYAKVFTFVDNDWVQKGQAVEGLNPGSDFFGNSITLSRDGSFLAVGAPQNSETGFRKGRIYVFKYVDGMWEQQGETIKGSFEHQAVGTHISMSDDGQRIASSNQGVHAPLANGIAEVYELQPTSYWTQLGSTIVGDDQDFLGFSISLSADGNTFATGSPWHNGDLEQEGEVRVFRYLDSDWQQWGETIEGEFEGGHFGRSVALSADGNTLVAGTPDRSIKTMNSGMVQVFQYGSVTGLNESNEFSELNIFPNPSTGLVTIDVASVPNNALVSILDITGKQVFLASLLQKKSTLDLTDLSNGIYFVRLETNDGVETSKLIVSK